MATESGWMTEVTHLRLMTGDGSQKVDHGRWMTINHLPFNNDFKVKRSYTMLEIKTLISNYKVSQERRYADRCSTTGIAPQNQDFNHKYVSE